MALTPGIPFCGYADRPAMPLIEQCAREVHDSVAHHDVNEADRSPRLTLELRMDLSLAGPGFVSAATLASVCNRLARVTIPTSLLSRITSTRLIWRLGPRVRKAGSARFLISRPSRSSKPLGESRFRAVLAS
jgi:hypothetical protein